MDTSGVASELFSEFPHWEKFARSETTDDGSQFIVIEVPAPSEANVEHELIIDTSNGEVTIGFDCYHSHFDNFIGDGEHFGTKAALEFIKQIVSERVGVVSWWSGEAWQAPHN